MGESRRYYVTTPIYYVNDRPHIGHAYCTVLADTMRRYRRLMGDETWFLTGTDEHGQKVQEAAERRGMSPQAHCDELHAAFRELWPQLHVEEDDFIRTTEPRHTRVVQAALQQLWEAGDITIQSYEGWYSTGAERFFTEKDLVDGRCPDTGQPVQWISEKNYFFRMSRYGERLRAHIEANPDFIRPPHRANEVLGFLDKGLDDLCISRPKERLAWGIELPFDSDYVTYVWFDALLNYVSAIGLFSDSERFERWWPHAHHLIGKDILTTHSVYWTTMLMALGLPLPRSITATGWWLQGDTKMSKSLGNVVSPLGMKDVYGADVLRFFLMRDMVIGLDANFSEEALVRRNNSDLANDLGNLARRVAGLCDRYFEGKVPEPGEPTAAEAAVMATADDLRAAVPQLVDDLKLHSAIEEIMQFVRSLNKYVTDTAPFRLVKTDAPAAGRILYTVLEGLRHAAWLLWPVMPQKMEALLVGLGVPGKPTTLDALRWGELRAGTGLGLGEALFPRAELPVAAPEAAPSPEQAAEGGSAKAEPAQAQGPAEIAFDQFEQVDLRVATVLSCQRVEGSDRLLDFQLDLGTEQRRVVSGLAQHIAPEGLAGTQVVLVANLAPRKIFKILSQGMILSCETPEGGLALLRPGAAVAAGAKVS
ncbi:MAG: methionine--tRNA ligase [Deltaproteobacteria bacterium]|nr:methionine--tRNA ligase [Deltaproteobacteria bacterium]